MAAAENTETAKPVSLLDRRTRLVETLAIAPDGKTVATSECGDKVKVWDLASGQPLFTLEGGGSVERLAYSRDGSMIASSVGNPFVKVWKANRGTEIRTIKVEYTVPAPFPVTCMTFSPDNRTVITGGPGPIKIWEIATGHEVGALDPGLAKDGKTLLSNALAISSDGKTLYGGYFDGSVRIWDLETKTVRTTLPAWGWGKMTNSLVLSPDEKTLACALGDFSIVIYDLTTNKVRARLPGSRTQAWTLAFSPDGRVLAAGCQDGKIRMWDMATGKPRGAFPAHKDSRVHGVAFTPDGKILASAAGNLTTWGEFKVWNVSAYTQPLVAK